MRSRLCLLYTSRMGKTAQSRDRALRHGGDPTRGVAPEGENSAARGPGCGDKNLGGLSRMGKTARIPGQGRTDQQPQEKPLGSLGAPAAPPAPVFFHTARHRSPLSLAGRIAPPPFPAPAFFSQDWEKFPLSRGRLAPPLSGSHGAAAVPLTGGSKKCAIWGLHTFREAALPGPSLLGRPKSAVCGPRRFLRRRPHRLPLHGNRRALAV